MKCCFHFSRRPLLTSARARTLWYTYVCNTNVCISIVKTFVTVLFFARAAKQMTKQFIGIFVWNKKQNSYESMAFYLTRTFWFAQLMARDPHRKWPLWTVINCWLNIWKWSHSAVICTLCPIVSMDRSVEAHANTGPWFDAVAQWNKRNIFESIHSIEEKKKWCRSWARIELQCFVRVLMMRTRGKSRWGRIIDNNSNRVRSRAVIQT